MAVVDPGVVVAPAESDLVVEHAGQQAGSELVVDEQAELEQPGVVWGWSNLAGYQLYH
jgi:hypothetical protein